MVTVLHEIATNGAGAPGVAVGSHTGIARLTRTARENIVGLVAAEMFNKLDEKYYARELVWRKRAVSSMISGHAHVKHR